MPRRELERLLTEWREAQRRLDDLDPGTPEHAAAEADVERLREQYQHEAEVRDPYPPGSVEGSEATA